MKYKENTWAKVSHGLSKPSFARLVSRRGNSQIHHYHQALSATSSKEPLYLELCIDTAPAKISQPRLGWWSRMSLTIFCACIMGENIQNKTDSPSPEGTQQYTQHYTTATHAKERASPFRNTSSSPPCSQQSQGKWDRKVLHRSPSYRLLSIYGAPEQSKHSEGIIRCK